MLGLHYKCIEHARGEQTKPEIELYQVLKVTKTCLKRANISHKKMLLYRANKAWHGETRRGGYPLPFGTSKQAFYH